MSFLNPKINIVFSTIVFLLSGLELLLNPTDTTFIKSLNSFKCFIISKQRSNYDYLTNVSSIPSRIEDVLSSCFPKPLTCSESWPLYFSKVL